MPRYQVRDLCSADFTSIMSLETQLFRDDPQGVLGPYYVRLCCDFFGKTCFVALADNVPVGYLLSFQRGREVICTTLGVLPHVSGTRVVPMLVRAFVQSIADRADVCWFTVTEDNKAARALHASLGAAEVEVRDDYYGPGDRRIVSKIDRAAFERLRAKYARLGIVGHPESGVMPRANVVTGISEGVA